MKKQLLMLLLISTCLTGCRSCYADPNDGEVSAIERNFTKSSMRNFDIKKFLKEVNALYKKVYLS